MKIDFYHWEDDKATGFRRLILDEIQTNLKTEREHFSVWDSEYSCCKTCGRNLPKTTYFFIAQKGDFFSRKCRECMGRKFKWGTNKQKELISKNKYYCNKCDTVYPLNHIYFNSSRSSWTGHDSYCKKCVRYSTEFGINRNLNLLVNKKDGFKICLTCHLELPENQYYYFKQRKDVEVMEPYCKKCEGHEYGVIRHNVVFQIDGYRYCHSCEDFLKDDEFYTVKNRKESYCKKCRYVTEVKRNHSLVESDFSISDWDFAKDYWTDMNGVIHCAYCDVDLDGKPQMEHIIPFSKGGGFTKDNIIPVCKPCNSSKNNRDLDYFYNYSDKFTYHLYQKVMNYIDIIAKLEVNVSTIIENNIKVR